MRDRARDRYRARDRNLLLAAVGGAAGFAIGDAEGCLVGAALTYLVLQARDADRREQETTARLDALERRMVSVSRDTAEALPPEEPPEVVASPPPRTEPTPEAAPSATPIRSRAPEAPGAYSALTVPPPAPTAPTAPTAPKVRPEPRPRPRPNPLVAVRAFLTGGNALVRLGLLILFLGFAFLVKYAVDHDVFPLELRLAATAATGLALAAFGWRKRRVRRDFGLSLQGGGVALVYLTIFAAFRLYGLVPASLAFGLLVAVTVLGGVLALLQEAQALVVLSLLGGLAAPALTSIGEGSHVLLFGYYAVLTGVVVALAWFRPWRALHLVGFLGTFTLFGAWLNARYEPALFGTTEPFLLVFFLSYFAVSLLYARHRPSRPAQAVEGTLVFGLPVATFTYQSILVQPYEFGLAWSALGFGAFYALAAWVYLRRRRALDEPGRSLVESFAGVALVLLSLVLPFALDATWTGTGWALEGAALVWLGLRQRRARVWGSGLLLQVLAMLSFAWGLFDLRGLIDPEPGTWPYLNRFFIGCLALALSAGFTARLARREGLRPEPRVRLRWAELVFFVLGLGWWVVGGVWETVRHLPAGRWEAHGAVLFLAATAAALTALRRRLDWPLLRVPPLFLLPLLVLLWQASTVKPHLLWSDGGWLAWPLAVAGHLWVLRRLDGEIRPRAAALLHAGGVWWLGLGVAREASYWADRLLPGAPVWSLAATLAAVTAVAFLVVRRAQSEKPGWPVAPWRWVYLRWGAAVVLGVTWIRILVGLGRSADPAPLPYLPLLNPFDLSVVFVALAVVAWYRASRRVEPVLHTFWRPVLAWAGVGTAFPVATVTLARTVHAYAGVPYTANDLWASSLFQVSLTVFWATLAVTVMAWAARRPWRTVWLTAAGLLGVTVVKLFLVDLSALSTVARIVSFLVVGALLLVVGYFAPVPPERRREPLPP